MTDVLKGARPKRPSVASCPDWLWDLVEACWAEDVSTRPTARKVVSRLSRIELPEPFVQEAIPTHVPPLARKRTCGSSSNTITKRPKVKLEREAERQGRAEKKRRNEIMQETDDGGGSKQLRIDNELSPHARGEGASGPIRRDHS
ncbi:hypothetical protein MPER_13925 [Moniliophthora perniciosa FA553]|nr:hypothetical protein MPER_13925 [Moniliophthora perniciosa FA553]